MDYKELGFAILKRRRLMKLSQEEVAQQSGISRNYFSMIERGVAENISVEILGEIAKTLEVELSTWAQILTGGES